MMPTIAFVINVWEQSLLLPLVDRVTLWALIYIVVMLSAIMIVFVVTFIFDVIVCVLNKYKAHRKWLRERRHFQAVRRIQTESYTGNKTKSGRW